MTTSNGRAEAIVVALVKRGLLAETDGGEAARVVDGVLEDRASLGEGRSAGAGPGAAGEPARPEAGGRRPGWLPELAAYAGGALLLFALVLVSDDFLTGLGRSAQFFLLAAGSVLTGGTAFAVGLVDRLDADVRRRLAATLAAVAIAAAGLAVGLGADAQVGSGDTLALTLALVAVLLLFVPAYRLAPALVLHLGAGSAATSLVFSVVDLLPRSTVMVKGYAQDAPTGGVPEAVGLLLVAVVWALLSWRGVWAEPTAGRLIAGGAALLAAAQPMFAYPDGELTPLFAGTVTVAAGVAYVRTSAWPWLVTAVGGLLLLLGDLVEGGLADAILLGGSGAVLLGAALLAWWRHGGQD